MHGLCIEHPAVLRARIILLVARCLRHFTFHRADQATHRHRAPRLTWVSDNTERMAVATAALQDPSCPSILSRGAPWQSPLSPPDVGTATAGQGNWSLSCGRSAGPRRTAQCCRWLPACRRSSKAPVTSLELFFPSEK